MYTLLVVCSVDHKCCAITAGDPTWQTRAPELTAGTCMSCAEPANGLPPAPRRSFSSGSWKGRKQQDAGAQQYESVVVRTATGGHFRVSLATCCLLVCEEHRMCTVPAALSVWMHVVWSE
jgi:hypothetical protein